MRPAQLASKAEDAASKLSRLVDSPQVVQLLQRPLPALPTAAQRAVLASCTSSLQQLLHALPDNPSNDSGRAALVELLRGVLRHQAVHCTGVLLVWLQQQQQQQQPQQLAAALLSVQALGVLNCSAAVAELMINMTQQLLQSGVIASWAELMQQLLLLQQQEASTGRAGECSGALKMFHVMFVLLKMWVPATPFNVATAVQAALPLLQQLQCYGRILTTATPPAAAGDSSCAAMFSAYIKLQLGSVEFAYQLCYLHSKQQLETAVAAHASSCLREPAVALLLLQLLAGYTMLLHQQHNEQQHLQQQQQQQQQSGKQQLRADLLPIPAFHQHPDLLQLLPGGQAYLDKAAAGSSDLPPEVLQQDGLQLLQALAAPLQQLQLTAGDDPVRTNAVLQAMLKIVLAFEAAADYASAPSSSSSSAQQVSWGYLLQLQQHSRRGAAAVAAFDAKWPGWQSDLGTFALGAAMNDELRLRIEQQYTDALELCRALAAAAQLPLVCNNPACERLSRDEMVPCREMQRLHQAVRTQRCTWVEFPNSRHMDAYEANRELYWPALRGFMQQNVH
uniref:Uncharacterized protein n=1 Tax=Tetradesmus obliquus TaxID=3088 RepID=A0A383VL02_TETOB|eukprot:jgi/Sobl393_1/12429/SZX65056.1